MCLLLQQFAYIPASGCGSASLQQAMQNSVLTVSCWIELDAVVGGSPELLCLAVCGT